MAFLPIEGELEGALFFRMKDSIDFATEPIGKLFRKMFLPTLIGMVSMVVLNITDGAFIGHGDSSDALAAVNIVAPIFLITSGIGLMFGIGSNVVASVHLSKGNKKAANLNLTQGVLAGYIIGFILGAVFYFFQEEVCMLFGCSEQLLPYPCKYLKWIALLTPFNMYGMITMFMVRLDGAPKMAMSVNLGMALTNILLDYIFIFPMHMGIEGAAIATTISFTIGNIPVSIYLFKYSKNVHFQRFKLSRNSLRLTLRNLLYQVKIGASALLGETAIASVMIVGNYMFMHYLGEDGVAAFSVGCYCLPIVFMMGNAIVQSVQPIISFAHGIGNRERLEEARNIALRTAAVSGVLGMLTMWTCSTLISATFLDTSCHAYQVCCEGMPWFSAEFLLVALNIVFVGYFQSVEKATHATVFTILRGFIFSIPAFIFLPMALCPEGLWLALPAAEALTTVLILYYHREVKS